MTDNPGVADTSLVEFGQTGQYPGTGQDAMPDWKKTAGFAPLETLPAAWFNGYMNELDTHINQLQNLTLQIQTEMANLMSAASVTPSGTNLTQIRQSIQKLIASSNDLLIAPDFDPEVSYSVGQYVLYNDYLYICTTAHTGAWNSAHFSVTKVGTKLKELQDAMAISTEYSTTEFNTKNKWIDGKSIYTKVIENFDVWFTQNTSFPSGDMAWTLAVFNGILYVGTYGHGIYTSTDGSTFTQNTSFPASYTVLALAVFNNTLYVGTEGHGIYTSTDGSTFTQNTSFPAGYAVRTLAVFNNALYAGTYSHGLYTSTDGSTFTKNTSFPASYTVLALVVFNNTLYAGTGGKGIYTSTDGSTFTQNTSFPASYTVLALAVFNNTLYAGTGGKGIYTSTDGSTFTQNTSFPTTLSAQALGIYKDTLYVGTEGHGIYTSTDGSTFTQNTSYPTTLSAQSFGIYKDTLYVGTGVNGIYISDIASAEPIDDISALLFIQLRNSAGPVGCEFARIESEKLILKPSTGTPTQAIIEYTKQEA